MWNMIWPVAIIVIANTFYNICAKSTPAQANPFLSLMVTYGVSFSVCFAGFLVFPGRENLTAEIGRLNWVSLAFGLCLVGLELGYIMAYRAGWKVSFLSLTANIVLACVLLVLGVFLYKEGISPKQLLGMAMCMGGLVLISR